MVGERKENCIRNIRKKNLKVILQRMDLVKHDNKKRKNMIKELVYTKKKVLKLNENNDDSESESESYRKVVNLLENEKHTIFDKTNMKLEEINLEKQSILSQNIIFPVIPKQKMDHMFSILQCEKKISSHEKKLGTCISHIHSCAKPPWNTPLVIFKAIKDSILRRKWENLAKLILMLTHFPCGNYKPMIRHMCQLLDKYHPVIRNKGLQSQFRMITLASKGTRTENMYC